MRIISAESGFLAYQKIFSSLMANQVPLTVWQVFPSTGRRGVGFTKISAFNLETKLLHMQYPSDLKIDQTLQVYFYSEEAQLIFKANLQEIREELNFSVLVPLEIHLFDEPDIRLVRGKVGLDQTVWRIKRAGFGDNELGSDIMVVKSMAQRSSRDKEFLTQEFTPVSLEEEDKMFASKREAPRARPKVDKMVKILVKNEPKIFKLHDLSQGGMGFLTNTFEEFDTGAQINILGFDNFDLDDALIGTIMNVRPIEGAEIQFKIGVKFADGQS